MSFVPAGEQGFSDVFGHLVTTQPYNQIEMRLDASDYADFTDTTLASGGSVSQASGLVTLATSTGATGSAILYSTDAVEYRPGVGVYGAGTAVFTAGVAGSVQYVGLGSDTSFANGVQFGYKGSSFGIRYMRGGAEVSFTAQADWDDPCLGAAGSQFTRDGAVETLDPAKGNLYRIEAGLFGFAGWRAQVWSPDNGWITVLTYRHINTAAVPVFQSNTFKVVLAATKTSGATSLSIKSQCWAAGTGSSLIRLGGTTTARTLAMPVLATLRATKPNGDHINIDATAGGNLKVSLEEMEAGVGLALEATQTRRLGGGKTAVVATVTSSGDTTVHTPASGQAIRLFWVSAINDPTALTSPLIKVKIGSSEKYRAYAVSHWEVFEGAANEVLAVNLSAAGSVAFTAHIEEFTP